MRGLLAILGLAACGRLEFELRDDARIEGPSANDAARDGSAGPADRGYFVEISVPDGGAMGGLAAADARCLAELTQRTWLGQANADQAGLLVPAKVRAWLCTTTGCQDLVPGALYQYASTMSPARGGATFVATVEGYLADDDRAYDEVSVFGPDSGFGEYFTGRGSDNLPQTTTCLDWTNGALFTDVAVNDTPFYAERLSKYPRACDESKRMICIVDR